MVKLTLAFIIVVATTATTLIVFHKLGLIP
jgi:hypothetical protein